MVEVLFSDGTYKYVPRMVLADYVKNGYVTGVKMDASFTIDDLRRIADREGIEVVDYDERSAKVRPLIWKRR